MDWQILGRIVAIERRLALLEGKPDPGIPCVCVRGQIVVDVYEGEDQWGPCQECGGSGILYPEIN